MTEHTPTIDGQHLDVLIKVGNCPHCKTPMIGVTEKVAGRVKTMFPAYYLRSLDSQLKRGGITYRGQSTDKRGLRLCRECSEAGHGEFICDLCKETHPSSLIESSFGDPAEYLCKKCYSTVPASVWDARERKLSERHRYDFQ